MKASFQHAAAALFLVLASIVVYAKDVKPDSDKYSRQEVMIPMRDGVKLHAVIFTPKGQHEKLPFLMLRTPYGVNRYPSPEKMDYVKDMASDGYIFVFEDIRGRYLSEGKYEMSRMSRDKKDPKSIDEASDTYDTVDWLLKNVPDNNGKAGEYGVSYDGWTSIIAASDPHPAMVAVSEQATPSDMFMNDDLHHNGAFRLSYAFEYAFMEEISKTDSLFQFGNYDTYDWYLKLGPLSNINSKYMHGKLPSWNSYVAHPNYDDFWKRQSLRSRLDSPRIAIQHVSGWWDQEDMVGPQDAYKYLEKNDRHNRNFIVMGPWRHGGWGGMRGAISLAIALTLPLEAYGHRFTERPTLVFLAAVVVVVTLVGQGLTLGPLLGALGLAQGDERRRREAVARQRVTEAGLARLDQLAEAGDVDEDTANVYRQLFELRLERVRAALGDDGDGSRPPTSGIRRELVRAQRAKLEELYRNRKINDEIRRSIALTLDLQDGSRGGGLPHA